MKLTERQKAAVIAAVESIERVGHVTVEVQGDRNRIRILRTYAELLQDGDHVDGEPNRK